MALAVGITVVAVVGGLRDIFVDPPTRGQSISRASTAQQITEVAPRPFTLTIPGINLHAHLEPMGLTDDGSLESPSDPSEVGWWAAGGELGGPGPTVLVGHRDSTTGPAVFYAAPSLLRGDPIRLTDGSGRAHVFVVDRVERHPRDAFPTLPVYAATRQPSLRLLTCGGEFTPGKGYADNWIVFADPA